MENKIHDFLLILKEFEKNKTYWSKYGSDFIITSLILFVFSIIVFNFYFLNLIGPIKHDWHKHRCNPAVMPFAGFINKPTNLSVIEYTNQNFAQCTNGILEKITRFAFIPIYMLLAIKTAIVDALMKVFKAFREFFDYLRRAITGNAQNLFTIFQRLLIPLYKFVAIISDFGSKMVGIVYTIFYFLISVLKTIFLTIFNIKEIIITILWLFAALIILTWIMFAVFSAMASIPFVGFVFAALASIAFIAAIAMTILFLIALIPIISIIKFCGRVMNQSSSSVPDVPACFSGNTLVELNNGSKKLFKNLKVGDILKNDAKVTTFFKCSSYKQELFKLNDTIVTGNHRVYCDNNGLIPVNKHPNSTVIKDFREPYVYCINTSSKTIIINNMIFSDWDDIDNDDILDLHINCCDKNLLPYNFCKYDIHKFLNCGFHEDTIIDIDDGRSLKIKDIEVNDVLRFGEKVIGIVEIDATDICGVYEYYLDNNVILKCSKNIEISNNLGNINTSLLEGNKLNNVKKIYNLITNKHSFYTNGINVYDYNSGLEKFLRKTSYGISFSNHI